MGEVVGDLGVGEDKLDHGGYAVHGEGVLGSGGG